MFGTTGPGKELLCKKYGLNFTETVTDIYIVEYLQKNRLYNWTFQLIFWKCHLNLNRAIA